MIQKHTRGRKIGFDAELGFPVREAYSMPMDTISLLGSVMANFCGSIARYTCQWWKCLSQRVMIDNAFSVSKCVRLVRIPRHSWQLLKKMWGALPGPRLEDLNDTWGEEILSLQMENLSEFEKQSPSVEVLKNARAVCENSSIQSTIVEFGPLLEASAERNLWSINLTHGDYPCNCLAQIV